MRTYPTQSHHKKLEIQYPKSHALKTKKKQKKKRGKKEENCNAKTRLIFNSAEQLCTGKEQRPSGH